MKQWFLGKVSELGEKAVDSVVNIVLSRNDKTISEFKQTPLISAISRSVNSHISIKQSNLCSSTEVPSSQPSVALAQVDLIESSFVCYPAPAASAPPPASNRSSRGMPEQQKSRIYFDGLGSIPTRMCTYSVSLSCDGRVATSPPAEMTPAGFNHVAWNHQFLVDLDDLWVDLNLVVQAEMDFNQFSQQQQYARYSSTRSAKTAKRSSACHPSLVSQIPKATRGESAEAEAAEAQRLESIYGKTKYIQRIGRVIVSVPMLVDSLELRRTTCLVGDATYGAVGAAAEAPTLQYPSSALRSGAASPACRSFSPHEPSSRGPRHTHDSRRSLPYTASADSDVESPSSARRSSRNVARMPSPAGTANASGVPDSGVEAEKAWREFAGSNSTTTNNSAENSTCVSACEGERSNAQGPTASLCPEAGDNAPAEVSPTSAAAPLTEAPDVRDHRNSPETTVSVAQSQADGNLGGSPDDAPLQRNVFSFGPGQDAGAGDETPALRKGSFGTSDYDDCPAEGASTAHDADTAVTTEATPALPPDYPLPESEPAPEEYPYFVETDLTLQIMPFNEHKLDGGKFVRPVEGSPSYGMKAPTQSLGYIKIRVRLYMRQKPKYLALGSYLRPPRTYWHVPQQFEMAHLTMIGKRAASFVQSKPRWVDYILTPKRPYQHPWFAAIFWVLAFDLLVLAPLSRAVVDIYLMTGLVSLFYRLRIGPMQYRGLENPNEAAQSPSEIATTGSQPDTPPGSDDPRAPEEPRDVGAGGQEHSLAIANGSEMPPTPSAHASPQTVDAAPLPATEDKKDPAATQVKGIQKSKSRIITPFGDREVSLQRYEGARQWVVFADDLGDPNLEDILKVTVAIAQRVQVGLGHFVATLEKLRFSLGHCDSMSWLLTWATLAVLFAPLYAGARLLGLVPTAPRAAVPQLPVRHQQLQAQRRVEWLGEELALEERKQPLVDHVHPRVRLHHRHGVAHLQLRQHLLLAQDGREGLEQSLVMQEPREPGVQVRQQLRVHRGVRVKQREDHAAQQRDQRPVLVPHLRQRHDRPGELRQVVAPRVAPQVDCQSVHERSAAPEVPRPRVEHRAQVGRREGVLPAVREQRLLVRLQQRRTLIMLGQFSHGLDDVRRLRVTEAAPRHFRAQPV
ncbi:uncharacterized protein BcabD6B2_16260 [Babesia caballi]|uniref:Membrane protein, putative n=1 Tax=Babesia caballi TaxID=5871 RepID=A0AAV4LPZ1_BABCB|nr:membrane protein, putative [Babesia caballi]